MRSSIRVALFLVLIAVLFLLLALPAGGSAAAEEIDVELIYFYPRFRCVSCEQVESYAAEAAASYRDETRDGIPYTRLAIDDPRNRELVERYGVVGSSLFLVTTRGEEENFVELKKVWFLWEDKEGCISYIHDEIGHAVEEAGAAEAATGIPLESIPLLAALLLGLITAISPCPLATNIAAVAYIAGQFRNRKTTVLSGILYTTGRGFSYTVLGVVLVYLGANVVNISGWLRSSGEYYLGPLLILVSLVMLDVINIRIFRGGITARLGERLKNKGLWGSFLLGALFALAFCPYSAVLFFGMLIPLSLNTAAGGIMLPLIYAVGTGMPVLAIALLIALGVSKWEDHVKNIQKFERYLRKLVGLVFLGVGVYYLVSLIKALT